MLRHWNYLKYVLRHKWFVLVAGRKIGAPLWRLLLHDLSKFLPSEWKAYANTFYKADGAKQFAQSEAFDMAWLLHQHRNKHHWNYWVLHTDKHGAKPMDMPEGLILEMVADWMAAGRVIKNTWEYLQWYEANRDRMLLSESTRNRVECIVYSPLYF